MISVTIGISSHSSQAAVGPAITPAPAKLTTMKELAELLKMDRSAARRYVMRLGHVPKRARTASSGFQTALVFDHDQVRQIVEARRADGYL
ncbi:hypothetical protein [Pseudomonas monteilii]|uniref:hypothetical protein n=1 Tax=Pseudomonas monteilii TaxID=76759 RepID=UPI001E53F051|nr:hypothetical protein [Pseudomonas monteilii]MCE0933427.1 hypothetical protein [Pseudomonas monteilii]WJR40756.1 hypothetical protein LU662_006975 [Pseudomonas monteilii]